MDFDVYVIDSNGNPIEDKKVTVFFDSVFRGYVEEYTDESGHAYFYDLDEGEAEIYVDHTSHGPYYIEDGNSFTIEA